MNTTFDHRVLWSPDGLRRTDCSALIAAARALRLGAATGANASLLRGKQIALMCDCVAIGERGPDDDPEDDVDLTAVGETDILNVLGPYVALEHRLSIDHGDEDDQDDTTRTVIDLRNGKPVALDRMLRDSTVREAAGEGGLLNRRWRHDGYDVISHYDSTQKANALMLRDRRGREWRLGYVASSFVQIFWLDQPRVDAATRHALARAFNDATAYGENIQQVSRRKPQPRMTTRARGRQT